MCRTLLCLSRRWFASWDYDQAQVTASSCGKVTSAEEPLLSVRAAPTTINTGPFTCVAKAALNCGFPDITGFTTTFTATGDTY